MASAAQDESYGNPRWRSRSRGCWDGWGWGGQNRGWGPSESWGPPGWHPYWGPHFVAKPLLIVATILGFMLWWPIGLALLIVTLCRRQILCGYHSWSGWQSASSGPGTGWKTWFGGERPAGNRERSSSGNRAFDEYRAETLHRLEEEQKEFAEFLERLRFAKDKAEFDQFMNERRNRPTTPPERPAAPAN